MISTVLLIVLIAIFLVTARVVYNVRQRARVSSRRGRRFFSVNLTDADGPQAPAEPEAKRGTYRR